MWRRRTDYTGGRTIITTIPCCGSDPVEFASPLSNIDEFMDAYHDGEEVRFHTMEGLIGDTVAPSLASRVLGDHEHELLLVEEPPTFVKA